MSPLTQPGLININLFNSLGQVMASYNGYFDNGIHTFKLLSSGLTNGLYVISVSNGLEWHSIKILRNGNTTGSDVRIFYEQSQVNSKILALNPGDLFNFTGYSSGYFPKSIFNQTPQGGENYEFSMTQIPNDSINPNELLAIQYFWIINSDGGHPNNNTDVFLYFEANGIAHLYLADDSNAISYSGTYSYTSGQLNLTFASTDFNVNQTFNIDLNADTVQMPFKVLSSGDGTSSWYKKSLSGIEMSYIIFYGAILSETISLDDAIDRAVQYMYIADGLQSAHKNTKTPNIQGSDPKITSVLRNANGLSVNYDNGTWIDILLYSSSAAPVTQPLQLNSLATDPRVHLDVTSPHNSADDPPVKTALIITPFDFFTSSIPFVTWLRENYVLDSIRR